MITLEQIAEVVNRHDPLGLLEMGCPKDEYTPEIHDLFERHLTNTMAFSYEEVKNLFERWFYVGCIKNEDALVIADELHGLNTSEVSS